MTFLELFPICTFKDQKLANKIYQFGRKSKKKLNSTEFMEFIFSKSGLSRLNRGIVLYFREQPEPVIQRPWSIKREQCLYHRRQANITGDLGFTEASYLRLGCL